MGAIIGKPEIQYCEVKGITRIVFPKAVYIEHLRILALGKGLRELISHKKFFESSKSFFIDTPGLQAGKTYLAEIEINGGSQLEYLFTA